MTTPSDPLIGLIGVGATGSRMGRRLADRDVRLVLYDSAPGPPRGWRDTGR